MSKPQLCDSEGFAVLKRIDPNYTLPPKPRNPIGEKALIRDKNPKKVEVKRGKFQKKIHRRSSHGYLVDEASKSWQHKCWRLIQNRIIWPEKNDFDKYEGSKKFRHIKLIAIKLKAEAETPLTPDLSRKAFLTMLADPKADKMTYPFCIASNVSEFKKLVNRWYDIHEGRGSDVLSEQANDMGYDDVGYVSRIFIVYDDASYDAFSASPDELIYKLNLKFNDSGKVVLKLR